MIQTIDIKVKECCEFGYNLSKQSNWMIGQAYCYDWDMVQNAAVKMNFNIDSLLTTHIGYYLAMKKPKRKFLIWFAPLNEMLFLTVTSKGSKVMPDWLADIAGYREQGQDYLRENSRPFLYYDGLIATRLHFVYESMEADAYYVSDFGNLFGLNVAATDKGNYENIRDNPGEYNEYSVVPFGQTQVTEWRGKKFIISHAFCRLV